MRTFVVAWRGLAVDARGFPKTIDFGFGAEEAGLAELQQRIDGVKEEAKRAASRAKK